MSNCEHDHLMIPIAVFMIDLNLIQEGVKIEVLFGDEWEPALISRGLCGYVPNNIPARMPDFIAKATKFDCSCNLWVDGYQNEWRFPS